MSKAAPPPMPQTSRAGRVAEFIQGARYLAGGIRFWARNPALMLLGAVPALIVSAIFVAGLVSLIVNLEGLTGAMTGFADGWSEGARGALRALLGVALVLGSVGLSVLVFTAVTLAVGTPIYEKISRTVENTYGGIRGEVQRPLGEQITKAIGDGVRLIGIALMVAVLVLVLGLIPVVGSVLGPVVAAIFGGRALATELTGTPCDARGLTLKQRQQLLKAHPWRALGFGVCCYLLFLIPLGAVIGTPAATAGGTLMARDLLGENMKDPVAPTSV